MKARERHTIPLSKQSIALIERQQQLKMSDFVFPNRSNGKSLSQTVMSSVLKRMNKVKEYKKYTWPIKPSMASGDGLRHGRQRRQTPIG